MSFRRPTPSERVGRFRVFIIMNQLKKWYVYAHINPVNGQTFYIGKGTGNRAYNAKGRNTSWTMYVNGLTNQGLTYSISVLHICDNEQDALDLESIEINNRLRSGNGLLNRIVVIDTIVPESLQELDYPIEMNHSELVQFVKKRRLSLKLTQAETANKAGVGLRFVRDLEQGKQTLRMDKVNQVLRLFGSKLIPK